MVIQVKHPVTWLTVVQEQNLTIQVLVAQEQLPVT